jgi:hypothetical protein
MIFSRAGFGYLKFAYLVLLAGFGVGAFIVGGSYLYWQAEKKNDQQSLRSSQDLRGRLVLAKRDRDDLLGSEDTYNALAGRGTFSAEQRFDLIEALAALKNRHNLLSLAYDVAPQRPLRLGAGGTFTGVSLLASRVKMKVRAVHDADLVAFLDEFPRLQRGFFPLDHCAIKRGTEIPAPAPVLNTPGNNDDAETPRAPIGTAGAALEAECSFEWITLQTKDGKGVTQSAATPAPGARPL